MQKFISNVQIVLTTRFIFDIINVLGRFTATVKRPHFYFR